MINAIQGGVKIMQEITVQATTAAQQQGPSERIGIGAICGGLCLGAICGLLC